MLSRRWADEAPPQRAGARGIHRAHEAPLSNAGAFPRTQQVPARLRVVRMSERLPQPGFWYSTSLCETLKLNLHTTYSVSIFAHHLGLLFVTKLAPRAPR